MSSAPGSDTNFMDDTGLNELEKEIETDPETEQETEDESTINNTTNNIKSVNIPIFKTMEETLDETNTKSSENFEIPDESMTNYQVIYESLIHHFDTSNKKSIKLLEEDKFLRQTLYHEYQRINAVMELLDKYENPDSKENLNDYLPDKSEEKLNSVINNIQSNDENVNKVLQELLNVSKILKNENENSNIVHKQLYQLYDDIPVLPKESNNLLSKESNPSNTRAWLKKEYPRIFSESGDILNTLRPTPESSAYILLNSLITLKHEDLLGKRGRKADSVNTDHPEKKLKVSKS